MPLYSYLDASAIVKLIAAEPETAALESALARRDGLLTSRVSVVEVQRAVRRAASRKLLQRVDDVFEAFVLIEASASILGAAGSVAPTTLRSLDAIHLATALSLHFDEPATLEFICYDNRLADAAKRAGLEVSRPQ